MKVQVSNFNNDLATALGMKVVTGTAMLRDGTFVDVYTYDERGFPMPLPDFEHSLDATLPHIPRHLQVIIRYSAIGGCWCCLLVKLTGELVAEEYDESQPRAVALALRSAVARLEVPAMEVTRP